MGHDPDFSRKILNANIGMINTIEQKDIRDVMIKTFDKILNILTAHCGPYAEFAIIKDQAMQTDEPIFTTDGVNIISAIEFASPMEEFVRSMVKYIGQRTEMAASDGTTSSMIITIATLKYLLKYMIDGKINTKTTYSEFKEVYNLFQERISTDILKSKYTVDRIYDELVTTRKLKDITRSTIIEKIAYNQAFTSSHGDVILSELVAEMFKSIPEKAWQFVSFERENVEKEWDYKLIIDDSQISIDAMVMDKSMLNSELGTELHIKKSKLITIHQPLMMASPEYQQLFAPILEKAIEEDEYLTIVIPSRSDNQTKNELLAYAKKHPTKKICIFTTYLENPEMNDLIVSLLVRGLSPLDVKQVFSVQENVKIDFTNNILKLNNLYVNKGGNPIHPYAENPEAFPIYTQGLDTVVRIMETIKNQSPNAAANERLQYYQKMFNALYLTKRATVRIGGKAHDNTAAIDKCMDTVGAVRETLRHGFTLGGCWTLWSILTNRMKEENKNSKLYKLLNSFKLAIDELHSISLGVGKRLKTPSEDQLPEGGAIYYDITKTEGYENFDIENILTKNVPIQPASIDTTIIDRFGEVALKFVYTNRVISPGTVYIEQKEKK